MNHNNPPLSGPEEESAASDKDLLRQALRALEQYKRHTRGVMIPSTHCDGDDAIEALRARLEITPAPVATQ